MPLPLGLYLGRVPARLQCAALELLTSRIDLDQSPGGASWTAATAAADWFLCATDGDRVLGVIWAEPTAVGEIAIVPPRLAVGVDEQVAGLLLEKLLVEVGADPAVRLALVMVDDDDAVGTRRVERNGFQALTEIEFLWSAAGPVDTSTAVGGVELVPAAGAERQQFETFMSRCWDDSDDCRELAGWRQKLDIDWRPALDIESAGEWCFLVQVSGRNVGAIRLHCVSDHIGTRSLWQITQLGVVPSERRRGYALTALIRLRQWADKSDCGLTTWVDGRNAAACQAYAAAGFSRWMRRELWARRV